MLNMLLALYLVAAHAYPKYENFESQALLGATVLNVSCPKAGGSFGHVLVVRDENNFEEHNGTADLAIAPAACDLLDRRASASLECFGEARIDLFLEHTRDGQGVIVDCGFARRLGSTCTKRPEPRRRMGAEVSELESR